MSAVTGAKKILWGVCGIGHGHIFRQLPLIEYFAKNCEIVIFGYGESYDFFKKRFENHPRIVTARVAVPFYVGGPNGLDFEATARHPDNNQDYGTINAAAMALATGRIGRPDLVVSDYEPVSAQYAYAHNAPLVTLDQQSKYLCGAFPVPLKGLNFNDEIMRLRLFFPAANERLACSFFRVAARANPAFTVTICPPVLNDAIVNLRRNPKADGRSILIYLSAQQAISQGFDDIFAICRSQPQTQFHIFGKNIPPSPHANLKIYKHGDPAFHTVLAGCNGIITTAGHSLLSEAMHLGIPVYAIPLPIYEQAMNAHVIDKNGFGLAHPVLDAERLARFIRNIPAYERAIITDRDTLLRDTGQKTLIGHLKAYIKAPPP